MILMYYITVNASNKITGFHYNASKTNIEQGEINITEADYDLYANKELSLLKYKYTESSIAENAKLV